jgi:hypothetical protein
VTTIGEYAFEHCSKLNRATIGNSVIEISQSAFSHCSNLASVTFKDTSGWYITETEGASSETAVDVSDPAIVAEYLVYTYENYYWHKK